MKKPEDKLSFMQTLLMVSGTMIGAGVLTLPRSAATADSPSGWIIILVQSVVFIGIVLLFMPFLQKNSGETIYELNQSIMGRAIGSLLNLFISCYFVVTVCFQARFLGEVINYFFTEKYADGCRHIHLSGGRHLPCDRRGLSHFKALCLSVSDCDRHSDYVCSYSV